MERLKNKMVLIVDDDDRNIFAPRSYLEMLDIKVAIAKTGEEAISELQNNIKADVILLDMMMPVMDGYETLGALEQHVSFKQIPVIAVTGTNGKTTTVRLIAHLFRTGDNVVGFTTTDGTATTVTHTAHGLVAV